MKNDNLAPGTVRVYTDGSGIDCHGGAAAVLLPAAGNHTKRTEYKYNKVI